MFFTNRNQWALWPTLLVVCGIGGWYSGSALKLSRTSDAADQATSSSLTSSRETAKQGFAAGSPRALWMERVKKAKASDFPKLLEEWENLFPYDDQYKDGMTPNAKEAMRWVYGMWLVNDLDGFLQASHDGSFFALYGAQALVELMPEKAAALLVEAHLNKIHEFLITAIAAELAEKHPLFYLQWDSEATITLYPHHSSADDWTDAIISLANTDAVAAGNACLKLKEGNYPRGLLEALTAVAAAWKPSDPPIAEWANRIADPTIRNYANHAWLSVLAEKDPNAAMKAISAMKWEDASAHANQVPKEILKHLTLADPIAALKLMKDAESYLTNDEADPFREPSPEKEPKNSEESFFALFSGKSEIRDAVLDAVALSLPSDPAGVIAEIRKLTAGLGGDEAWQRSIEAHLIQGKSVSWSTEECLEAAERWAIDSNTKYADATLEKLAIQAARYDPEKALANLQRFPEQARPILLREIIKRLPSSNTAREIELLRQLPPAQWDSEIGEALGRNASVYASFVAEMPLASSSEALGAFTREWGEENPELAANWLDSLPDESAKSAAAEGLASAWITYDGDAATAWAASLPDGPVRDAAAQRISYWFSMGKSADAWTWAETISDPQMRAKAYGQVAIYWRKNVPDEFRTAHDKARKEAGLPASEPETNHLEDPFE